MGFAGMELYNILSNAYKQYFSPTTASSSDTTPQPVQASGADKAQTPIVTPTAASLAPNIPTQATPASPSTKALWIPADKPAYLQYIRTTLKESGVVSITTNAKEIWALIAHESSFNSGAVSFSGAIGLTQMMPESFLLILDNLKDLPTITGNSRNRETLQTLRKLASDKDPILDLTNDKSIKESPIISAQKLQVLSLQHFPAIIKFYYKTTVMGKEMTVRGNVIIESNEDLGIFKEKLKTNTISAAIIAFSQDKIRSSPQSLYARLAEPSFNIASGITFLREEKDGNISSYNGVDNGTYARTHKEKIRDQQLQADFQLTQTTLTESKKQSGQGQPGIPVPPRSPGINLAGAKPSNHPDASRKQQYSQKQANPASRRVAPLKQRLASKPSAPIG